MRSLWLVYWLYDDKCICYARHGCIGAVKKVRLWSRLAQHQKSTRITKDFRYKILFAGSQKQALAIEAMLRPKPHTGWNVGVGGFANGGGLKGIPKPPEQREKQRLAALARYARPGEKEKTSKAVKRGLKHVDRSGSNNANYGKHQSEATKEKVRAKIIERGGVSGANNPNYRHGLRCT